MMDFILDTIDTIKYKYLKIEPKPFRIPTKLELVVRFDKKNKVYWAECESLPDFIATADTQEHLLIEIFDTLLLYFNVPRYFAKQLTKPGKLTLPNGKVISLGENISLNYAS